MGGAGGGILEKEQKKCKRNIFKREREMRKSKKKGFLPILFKRINEAAYQRESPNLIGLENK